MYISSVIVHVWKLSFNTCIEGPGSSGRFGEIRETCGLHPATISSDNSGMVASYGSKKSRNDV